MARKRLVWLGLAVLWACSSSPPDPQLTIVPDTALPDVAQQLDETTPEPDAVADLVADEVADVPSVELPDCPFKPCDPKDFPELTIGPCEKLGWDAETCDCAVFQKAEGAPCDDGEICTAQDYCSADGACLGGAEPACSDNNLCTNDKCVAGEGCVHTPNEQPCEDGNPCTESDMCADGICQPGIYSDNCGECLPDSDNCEELFGDDDACNGLLVCVDGQCEQDPDTVVVCAPSPLPCVQSVCLPESGICETKNLPNASDCDDGNLCTKDDYCVNGECKGFLNSSVEGCKCEADADCVPLDDANLCNGTMACIEGACVLDPESVPAPCDSSGDLPCVKNTCVPATGLCEATEVAEGTPCGSADPCIGAGICTAGECAKEPPMDCDDNDPCTVDACSNGVCSHEPGGGEWTVELVSEPYPVAPEGLPAAPATMTYQVVNLSEFAQGFHIQLVDSDGTPMVVDWVGLDTGYLALEPGGQSTFQATLYPAVGQLGIGNHVASIAVVDECLDNPKQVLVGASVDVVAPEPETIFQETFDDDPFPGTRWTVYMGDCSNAAPGTVAHYANAFDACGDVQGYLYREYKGDRCIEYTGAPFSSADYDQIQLAYSYRVAGGSIDAAVHTPSGWSGAVVSAKGKDMAQWKEKKAALSTTVDGLRFYLKSGKDELRRLDCIALEGVPKCVQLPTVEQSPSGKAVDAGDAIELAVSASGTLLSYRWYKDDEPLTEDARIHGVHSPTLSIADAVESDEGFYHVVVTDHCGTTETSAIMVVVN